MAVKDNNEFKFAVRDIAANASNLNNPYDRVRCSEWLRKLATMPDDDSESSRTRNQYAQLLKIQTSHGILHGPFAKPPPDGPLCALAECLGNFMAQQVPHLPRTGRLQPVLYHRSPDGRAYVTAKQIPGGGVLCYMAVSPESLKHAD